MKTLPESFVVPEAGVVPEQAPGPEYDYDDPGKSDHLLGLLVCSTYLAWK